MNAFRCLRVVARRSASPAVLGRSSIACITPSHRLSMPSATRSISLLAPRRPTLPPTSRPTTLPASSASPSILSPDALDLMPKVSSHPGLSSIQIRCGPRDTYNPSHFVRKRRHGFITRLKSKKGRKLLMRRIKKGRWNLSH